MKHSKLILLLLLAICNAELFAATLNIPAGHPRLWFTSEAKLSQARAWYALNPTTPNNDDYLGLAFQSLMTQNPSGCQAAVQPALDIQIDTSQVSSDSARWYGETALLIYDWCYDQFSSAQRNQFTQNWNSWQQTLNAKPWGGTLMESNNYYWGYLRNGLEWGITSFGDNVMAQGFIDHALDERFQYGLVEQWAPYFGKGGVPGEGTQYGRYMLGYGVIPLISAQDYGFDTYNATNFYRENLFYLIYSTLPKKTSAPANTGCSDTYWYLFPFNDDEQFFNCFPETAKTGDYGNLLSSYIHTWPQTPLAGFAQQWLDTIQPNVSPWTAALTQTVAPTSFQTLPLDYYATGSGFTYLRNQWQADSTIINLQLGVSGNVGHTHLDAGSFQVWQNGHWLSRETTAYTHQILDWGAGPNTVDALNSVGHNVVLFQGRGQQFWSPIRADQVVLPSPPDPHHDEGADGIPTITRIHHHPDFFFASTSLSKIYRARENRDPCRYDWPYAESVVRDFVYLRDLNALVILDRLKASSDSQAYSNGSACTFSAFDPNNPALNANQVSKTFLLHFLNQPQVTNNQVTGMIGNEKLILTTLLPTNPNYNIFHEGSSVGQYRLELNDNGQAESYFLNVLQFGDNTLQPLAIQLSQTQSSFDITLDNDHSLSLQKGMNSAAGSITINNSTTALTECTQAINITGNGPHWGAPECIIFKNSFEPIDTK